MTEHELDGKRVIVVTVPYQANREAGSVIGIAHADGDCLSRACRVFERGNHAHYWVEAEDNNESSKVADHMFHERELAAHPSS